MAGAKGLGRGLDVLLGGMGVGGDQQEVVRIGLDSIRPNPRQPRQEFDQQALEDLAGSIKEQGVLQPIMVRPVPGSQEYELVAGERRLRASKLAGLTDIPAMIRDVTDEQSLAIALIENLQRENLNALEEARGFDQLQKTFGLAQEALAQKVGKSRSAVANSLRLLQLSAPIQDSLFKDEITAGHARSLLSVTDENIRTQLWQRMLDLGLSVRESEDQAAYWKEHGGLPESAASAVAKSESKGRKRQAVPEELTEIAGKLRDHFKTNVKLGGDPEKGRITFSYSSPEELRALLDAWGV